MLIDTFAAVKKLRAAGMPEKQAEAITGIIANIDYTNIDYTIATKADSKMLVSKLETRIDILIAKLGTKIDTQTTWLIRSMFVVVGLLIKIAFF